MIHTYISTRDIRPAGRVDCLAAALILLLVAALSTINAAHSELTNVEVTQAQQDSIQGGTPEVSFYEKRFSLGGSVCDYDNCEHEGFMLRQLKDVIEAEEGGCVVCFDDASINYVISSGINRCDLGAAGSDDPYCLYWDATVSGEHYVGVDCDLPIVSLTKPVSAAIYVECSDGSPPNREQSLSFDDDSEANWSCL